MSSRNGINGSSLPRHVAIIMDGNGRWARQRGLPRLEGHRAGFTAVQRVVDACLDQGVRYLTLFSFSTENWQRSASEVSGLMSLFYEALTEHVQDLVDREISLRVIGDIERLPENVKLAIQRDVSSTSENNRLTLTLAVSYGAREEIVFAAKQIAERIVVGELEPADIDEATFANALWTKGLPDPDLLIRTSGEMRISNFLLWQLAYSEIAVVPEFWPEFDAAIFKRCLDLYAQRERRFGKTSEQLLNEAESALGR